MSEKTDNGSDWPMNYAKHSQTEMDYAWRSAGSYVPDDRVSKPKLDPEIMAIYECGEETDHTECATRHPKTNTRGHQK